MHLLLSIPVAGREYYYSSEREETTRVVLQLASLGYSAGLAASLEHQLEKYCPQCFVFWPGRPWQHWGAGEVSPHLTPAQVQPLSPSAFTDLTSSNRSVRFYSFYPTWEITSQECPGGSALHSNRSGREQRGTGNRRNRCFLFLFKLFPKTCIPL